MRGQGYLFYLLSEWYRKCDFWRTWTFQKNRYPYKVNELIFKKNVHLVFYSYLEKNLSKPWQRLEAQETIRHSLVLCFITYSTEWGMISVLFPVNMQTSDCLAFILPECTELVQRKVSVPKQQEKKPLQTPGSSKKKGELLFILKWHWRTVGTRSTITWIQTS